MTFNYFESQRKFRNRIFAAIRSLLYLWLCFVNANRHTSDPGHIPPLGCHLPCLASRTQPLCPLWIIFPFSALYSKSEGGLDGPTPVINHLCTMGFRSVRICRGKWVCKSTGFHEMDAFSLTSRITRDSTSCSTSSAVVDHKMNIYAFGRTSSSCPSAVWCGDFPLIPFWWHLGGVIILTRCCAEDREE